MCPTTHRGYLTFIVFLLQLGHFLTTVQMRGGDQYQCQCIGARAMSWVAEHKERIKSAWQPL